MKGRRYPAAGNPPGTVSRRRFILSAATATLSGSITQVFSFASVPRQLHVVIVGAGAAGLCAAYELEQRGHRVTLLEANGEWSGGRIRTHRFADGLYGELGAMRIPANHRLTLHYVHAFRLALRKFIEYNPQAYYFVHGVRSRNGSVAHMDRQITGGMDGRGPTEWSQSFHEIVGGMDALPAAFVARLKSKPKMGCEVTHIEQDAARGHTTVRFRDHLNQSNKSQTVTGDYVICTLPVPLLKRIKMRPELSAEKLRAMSELPYLASNKVLAETAVRFWELDDRIYGGGTYTDLPTKFTYYPSDNADAKDHKISAGSGVLLASYTIGKAALKYASLPSGQCAASALKSLAAVHPQLAKHGMIRNTLSWSWDNHPWSRGAFASASQHRDLSSLLAAPEGMVFFAGEHCSAHRTWIQGALESALLCVHRILAASSG